MPNPAYTSPSYLGVPVTGTQLGAQSPTLIRQVWAKQFEIAESSKDFWRPLTGPSIMSVIQTRTDTSVGKGQKVTFPTASQLYGEPHFKDELFENSAHFEELKTGATDLTVEWFRHAVRINKRTEEYMGMRGEIKNMYFDLLEGKTEEMGSWAGRLKSELLWMSILNQCSADSLVDITAATNPTIGWDAILENSTIMKRWGAPPAMVGRANGGKGAPIRRYVVVGTTDGLLNLKQDSVYRDIVKNTRSESNAEMLFTGGYNNIDGHEVLEYEAIDHDGYGATGSPLQPTGRLGVAITLSTTTAASPFFIYLGGSDYDASNILIKPSKYFPNYAYRYTVPAITAGTTAFYVAIVNPPQNAAGTVTDPNKYGLYKCLTNDGVRLSVTDALVDNSGVANTSGTGGGPNLNNVTGGITWLTANNSYTHATDSLVVLVNSAAKPIYKTLILGACAARRGIGMDDGSVAYDDKEAKFINEAYYLGVWGQYPKYNRKNRSSGIIVITHLGKMVGTGQLPQP